MPKCPFTKVFNQPTTTPSTRAPTTSATAPPRSTVTTAENAEATTPEVARTVTVTVIEEKKTRKEISISSTELPTGPKAAKHSADDTSKFHG